eukprot:8647129-Pyramimonas_sp.AAC.1
MQTRVTTLGRTVPLPAVTWQSRGSHVAVSEKLRCRHASQCMTFRRFTGIPPSLEPRVAVLRGRTPHKA